MTTTENILNLVCTAFGVTLKDLRGPRRHRNLADARMTAGYFLLTETGADIKDMPRLLKRTRHWGSFALYRCPELAEMEPKYQQRVNAVYTALQGVAA